MSPNNIGVVRGGDRGGRVIPPPPPPPQRNQIQLEYPPHLFRRLVSSSPGFLSLFSCLQCFVMSVVGHPLHRVLGQANAPLYAMGTPETLRKVMSAMRRQNLTSYPNRSKQTNPGAGNPFSQGGQGWPQDSNWPYDLGP
jgi:hypothetical protein